jgi:hypothetical protein
MALISALEKIPGNSKIALITFSLHVSVYELANSTVVSSEIFSGLVSFILYFYP